MVFLETTFKNKHKVLWHKQDWLEQIEDGNDLGLLQSFFFSLNFDNETVKYTAIFQPYGEWATFTGKMSDHYSKKANAFWGMVIAD